VVSGQIVKQLEDRGWIEAIGYRESPGRPALYGTTRQFLDDLGLSSLSQLPEVGGGASAGEAADALAPAAHGAEVMAQPSHDDLPIFRAASEAPSEAPDGAAVDSNPTTGYGLPAHPSDPALQGDIA
jgi:segregation and condensation protein B